MASRAWSRWAASSSHTARSSHPEKPLVKAKRAAPNAAENVYATVSAGGSPTTAAAAASPATVPTARPRMCRTRTVHRASAPTPQPASPTTMYIEVWRSISGHIRRTTSTAAQPPAVSAATAAASRFGRPRRPSCQPSACDDSTATSTAWRSTARNSHPPSGPTSFTAASAGSPPMRTFTPASPWYVQRV